MSIPIIFVHRSNSVYLKYTLKQARYFNPGVPIYLIGDTDNDQYNFITHANIDDYYESAREFSKSYVHMSFTPQKFEQFCFERWFIIKDFVTKNNLQQFLCLDSDVLLFCTSDEVHNKYNSYSFTIRGSCGAGLNYFSSIKALQEFCEYTAGHYTNHEHFHTLELNWAGYQERKHGGVCDMLLLALYLEENKEKIGDVGKIENNELFEYCNLDLFQNNEKLIYKNRIPYVLKKETGTWVKLKAFHINAEKDKIYRYYTAGGLYTERLKDWIKDMRDKYQLRTRIKKLLIKS